MLIDTFYMAYKKRDYPKNVMFHSDRGCQYTSSAFRKTLDKHGYIPSFSAKGYPYDNSVAESFFKYLKKEELSRKSFANISELKLSVFEYIESFYNAIRPHSFNQLLSPNEKELDFLKNN